MRGRTLFRLIDKGKWVFASFAALYRVICKINYILQMGVILRYMNLRVCAKSCGTNVTVHKNVYLFYPGRINIGSNVSIHPMCYIDAEGGLDIGNNVSIAHNTTIMTANHTWGKNDVPIKYNPKSYKRVTIGDDVWIGASVRIMPGVTVGRHCVIAAGAVVTKNCESNWLYGGVPAVKIKQLTESIIGNELQKNNPQQSFADQNFTRNELGP